jgi:predicted nuclease with TOPRIM domain
MKDNELNETAAKLDSLQIQVKQKHVENQRLDEMIQEMHHRIAELESKIKNSQEDKGT